ncbi:hypothetical protein FHU12_1074 [Serratia marcescens]|uniref:Uncharacterized protein n=1 Tax=Serratia marcescens TaxID=615 RepID=A0AA46K336_SERMA|nr:hypothetical protein FHU12_1074 [Serratia marcescens]
MTSSCIAGRSAPYFAVVSRLVVLNGDLHWCRCAYALLVDETLLRPCYFNYIYTN